VAVAVIYGRLLGIMNHDMSVVGIRVVEGGRVEGGGRWREVENCMRLVEI
jgi:hypothetical protein